LEVKPLFRDEVARWDLYMQRYHYLGLKWLALLGWSSASKNFGAREQYIGWSGEFGKIVRKKGQFE
jgi:hypothetical protein